MATALIVVDTQNDFCEGGRLAVAGGYEVGEKIDQLITGDPGLEHPSWDYYVASQDWHAPDGDNGEHFAPVGQAPDYDKTWPHHCIANTHGAELHPALLHIGWDAVVRKGWREPAYSAFEGGIVNPLWETTTQDLADWLRKRNVTTVSLVGIATDYCVRQTALDARKAGFRTEILFDYTAAVGGEDAKRRVREEFGPLDALPTIQ